MSTIAKIYRIENEKNLLTKKGGNAIIFLPLVEGSFFVHFSMYGKGTPGGRYWRKPKFTGGMPEFTGGAEMRVKITLACSECKQRNYDTKKNKKNDPDRLEMNKYCRFCRKHTLHKETK